METWDSKDTHRPVIEALTHRLSQCPREFLEKPRIGKTGTVSVWAVVADLIYDMVELLPSVDKCSHFINVSSKDINWLQLVLITSWLLHDKCFKGNLDAVMPTFNLLNTQLKELADVVEAENFVIDPERREELVRFCLKALNLIPEGETQAQALDRLKALDSIERVRVMREAKKREEHARKVREAMKKRKAQEAASKVMRE